MTIIVGGQVYKEYSTILRSWSKYFDTSLESGMKEAINKRFEFDNLDPKDWEWIMDLMAPLSVK